VPYSHLKYNPTLAPGVLRYPPHEVYVVEKMSADVLTPNMELFQSRWVEKPGSVDLEQEYTVDGIVVYGGFNDFSTCGPYGVCARAERGQRRGGDGRRHGRTG